MPLTSRSVKDNKLHPCAFLSCKLSSSEQNYDVGDRELLAMKAALEEWRHWLEGAVQPFLVWTDHKNLEYVRRAKRLNPRQSRWTLFFSRFNFVVTFRPGSENVKPDALSRIHDADNSPKSPEPILPNTCVVGGVSWEIEDLFLQALQGIDVPENCPTGRLFVPDCLRSQVIHWSHSSQLSCHPGVKRT